jgi:hypothetical protein
MKERKVHSTDLIIAITCNKGKAFYKPWNGNFIVTVCYHMGCARVCITSTCSNNRALSRARNGNPTITLRKRLVLETCGRQASAGVRYV